jgi:hypothetical protein
MSRPLKIIPPIKGTFNEILTRIADGHGVNKPVQPDRMTRSNNVIKATDKTPPKKP